MQAQNCSSLAGKNIKYSKQTCSRCVHVESSRRTVGIALTSTLAGVVGTSQQAKAFMDFSKQSEKKPQFPITYSDAEWQEKLSGDQYYILRQSGTELPFTSPLNKEKRKGNFVCAGCNTPLFSSSAKYNSGTGWPSFYEPLKDAVYEEPDYSLFMSRTEVRCAQCGGHLGHVFNDGPRPTGLRYCMNGEAMLFQPDEA